MSNIFCKTKEVIEKQGWTQGTFGGHDRGPVCLLGGLCVALSDGATAHPDWLTQEQRLEYKKQVDRLSDFLNEKYPESRNHYVWDWNDRYDVKKDNVLSVLQELCSMDGAHVHA